MRRSFRVHYGCFSETWLQIDRLLFLDSPETHRNSRELKKRLRRTKKIGSHLSNALLDSRASPGIPVSSSPPKKTEKVVRGWHRPIRVNLMKGKPPWLLDFWTYDLQIVQREYVAKTQKRLLNHALKACGYSDPASDHECLKWMFHQAELNVKLHVTTKWGYATSHSSKLCWWLPCNCFPSFSFFIYFDLPLLDHIGNICLPLIIMLIYCFFQLPS